MWPILPIKNVALGIFDGPHATPKRRERGPVFLGISSLDSGRIDLSKSDHVSEEDFTKWTRRVTPETGDLVFSYETRIGEAATIPFGLRCCLGRRMALVRPNREKIDPRFLLFAFLGPEFQEVLRERTIQGSTVERILLTEFPDFPIRLPPLPEQRRIAAILGALDDKIELNRKMNRTLEEMAQALFKSWFIDFDGHDPEGLVDSELGPIPRGWKVVSLSDEVTLDKGLSYKSEHFDDAGRPLVNLKCIERNGGFRRDGMKFYSGEYKERHVVRAGDIVIAMTDLTQQREVIASPALVPEVPGWNELLMSLDLACPRIHSDSGLTKVWLYRRLKTPSFHDFAFGFTNGTTVLHLKMDGVERYRFARPPPGAIQRFTSVVSPLHERMSVNRRQSDTLAELRDTLLPKLISGEIRVPEAEDAVEAAL